MAKHDRDKEMLSQLAAMRSPGTAMTAHGHAGQEILDPGAALRLSNERMESLLQNISDGFLAVDRDWSITCINQHAADLLGARRAAAGSLPRRQLWQAFPALCGSALESHYRQALETRVGMTVELYYVPLQRWLEVRTYPSSEGLTSHIQDISQRRQADAARRQHEQNLRDESNLLELLNRTGATLAGTLDLRALLQAVTDSATSISGAHFGAFFYQDPGHTAPTLQTQSGAASRAQALLPPQLRGGAMLRIDDAPADPRYDNIGEQLGVSGALRSYLIAPVHSRFGEAIGYLLFGHPEAAMFSQRTERIIAGIAAQAAVALDNTRMYAAAQQAAQERKILLDSERSARNEAEHSNQIKDEFLSTLSHELRTPLSAILGWAQVLRRGTRDQADLHRGLQSIERNARAQAQLIEDLLDMSRITSGKVLLDMQSILPATVIDAAIEALRPAAEAKNIQMEMSIDPAAGPIAGDASRLQQVMWNLLSNALKFTPRDGRVQIAVRQADDAHVDITVSDNGIGIEAPFLGHVFERFRQADASTTRKHGGLGLGLAIVKHLVEQHGGTVSASSEGLNRGASFTLRLPLASDSAASRQMRSYAPLPRQDNGDMPLRDLSGVKVLVVDDEADARELIQRILSDCKAEVVTAASAAQALHLVVKTRPDVLVSDIGMPDIDGFELLALVRALGPESGGALPAVALTGFARSQERQRALASGFRAHVSKPVEPTELIAAVAGLVAPGMAVQER
ncbi:hybrid sensor histidine kinase/response regulator [Janthinobacterium agaricidamnosum]|uniref:Virulence sensor protein BvgS n=1 Tax=Janthinobacterium agaricidamnosum NBRC 102515 = DSM 9628 TaxID=1349767 RepID=W0V7I9_9BURK|nr:ATP-binding protein [Janthinobacterium agaricidamnosum]CDG83550.1 his Kinase A domain protein [Janthinobacterium agaricidamnosum NBRC 102515 = DSM 9628]